MTKWISCSQKDIAMVKKQPEKSRFFCQELEKGNILFFEKSPVCVKKRDQEFLLRQKQTGNASRKNIAYKPHQDAITNLVLSDISKKEREKFVEIMRNYAYGVEEFLGMFLSPYQSGSTLDYGSFRSIEEKNRNLRKRARNDLLHIDAFPSRPVHGKRILRCFMNINPSKPRKWITSDTFSELLEKFSDEEVFQALRKRTSANTVLLRSIKKCARMVGIPLTLRSTYDEFMLQLHHFLKENDTYQKNCPKHYWDFPPQSLWILFGDALAHAVIEGRFALEQTLLVSRDALLYPKQAPVSILEQFSHQTIVNPGFARF